MPNTRDLVDLCEGICLARRGQQLQREEELQETLLRLYRSPEVLLRLTGSRIKKLG